MVVAKRRHQNLFWSGMKGVEILHGDHVHRLSVIWDWVSGVVCQEYDHDVLACSLCYLLKFMVENTMIPIHGSQFADTTSFNEMRRDSESRTLWFHATPLAQLFYSRWRLKQERNRFLPSKFYEIKSCRIFVQLSYCLVLACFCTKVYLTSVLANKFMESGSHNIKLVNLVWTWYVLAHTNLRSRKILCKLRERRGDKVMWFKIITRYKNRYALGTLSVNTVVKLLWTLFVPELISVICSGPLPGSSQSTFRVSMKWLISMQLVKGL